MSVGLNVVINDIACVFLQIDLFLGREHSSAGGNNLNFLELWRPLDIRTDTRYCLVVACIPCYLTLSSNVIV